MRNGVIFWAILVGSAILVKPSLGAPPTNQTPARTRATQQQMKPPTMLIPVIRGHVKYPSGSAVSGIEISLRKIEGGGRVSDYRTYTTGSTGGYYFNFTTEDIGRTYKIVPKYQNLSAGQYCTPGEKQITLAAGDNTVDFSFNPPPHEVSGIVKIPEMGMGLPMIKMTLTKLSGSGSGQSEVHDTDYLGRYSFTVPYENLGTSYKLVPKYLDWLPGENFTPKDKTFTIASGVNTIDFLITPPDISVDSLHKQKISADQFVVKFIVKNQGIIPSPPTRVHVYHNEQHYRSVGGNPVPEAYKMESEIVVYDIPGLTPGEIKVYTPQNRFYTDQDNYIRIAIDAVHELDWNDNTKEQLFEKETWPTNPAH